LIAYPTTEKALPWVSHATNLRTLPSYGLGDCGRGAMGATGHLPVSPSAPIHKPAINIVSETPAKGGFSAKKGPKICKSNASILVLNPNSKT
jgi:hypothetical protein